MNNNQTIKKVKAEQEFTLALRHCAYYVRKLSKENDLPVINFASRHADTTHLIFEASEREYTLIMDFIGILKLATSKEEFKETQKEMREQILQIMDYGYEFAEAEEK